VGVRVSPSACRRSKKIQKAVPGRKLLAVYESDWFTRLWVVQEVALARNPRILCGAFDLSWEEFQVATRIIAWCVPKSSPQPRALKSSSAAFDIISIRGRYSLNVRLVSTRPVTVQLNYPWNIGSLAWDMRKKNCKDDKDRVYALLSLTSNSFDFACTPDSFLPDYTRPVEWAYHQFWRRYGGYSSLFYAGLSRRPSGSKANKNEVSTACLNDDYLPSWVPDLRQHDAKEWKPIFSPDYGTSTPFQHMNGKFTKGLGILMLRGHRFDIVVRGFHATRKLEPWQKLKDFVGARATMNFFLSLQSEYEPYPSGQPWVEALGCALMTEMPYERAHPFQRYLDAYKLNTKLSDDELHRIWKLYLDLLLADTGDVWTKFCSVFLSKRKFDPYAELDHDGQLAWMLHRYLGDVLQVHRLIITSRGYMGLAPPDTDVGDIVVAFGGPGVPFVVRDTSLEIFGKLVADDTHGHAVPDDTGRILSQLLGPCYLQGIMRQELLEEERHKDFEWEKDSQGTIPKPTLCLI
jgi:hypothetical protein